MALLGDEATGITGDTIEVLPAPAQSTPAARGGPVNADTAVDSPSADSPSVDSLSDASPSTGSPTLARPTRRRPRLLLEVAWLVFLVWIYDWLQDLAPLRRQVARVNAEHILSFETRLGIDPERTLDHWLAHHTALAWVASNFYDNAIFAVTFGFAVFVYWRRPELYRSLRNILILSNLIGFAIFWAFPVAPPRMLRGFVDVVQQAGGLGAWHDTLIKHADQLAAMPSMHLGYAVWCGVAAWRMARDHAARMKALAFGAGYAVLTAFVVLATGNHYLLDVVAGTTCTLVSVVLADWVPWRSILYNMAPA